MTATDQPCPYGCGATTDDPDGGPCVECRHADQQDGIGEDDL